MKGRVPQCFAAGTKVVMADGSTKAVEDVRPGDRVESRSDEGDERGKIVAETVEREFELPAPGTLLLEFEGGASVEVTAVHPIYAVGRGFTPAGDLRIGDRVAEDREGRVAVLRSVVRLGTPKPVYNLTVGGTHTYFVRAGEDDLWVHNAPCPPQIPSSWLQKSARSGGTIHYDPSDPEYTWVRLDPADKFNGPHVHVSDGGRTVGRGGVDASGTDAKDPIRHIPRFDWDAWKNWNSP